MLRCGERSGCGGVRQSTMAPRQRPRRIPNISHAHAKRPFPDCRTRCRGGARHCARRICHSPVRAMAHLFGDGVHGADRCRPVHRRRIDLTKPALGVLPRKAGEVAREARRWGRAAVKLAPPPEKNPRLSTPPPPCFACSPSPALRAGADKHHRSRGALAPEFCKRRSPDGAQRNPGTHRSLNSDPGLRSAPSGLQNKGKRNAGRRMVTLSASTDAARVQRDALACRRSTAALARGLSPLSLSSRPGFLRRGGTQRHAKAPQPEAKTPRF